MTARVLIVDDEPFARERIRALLAGEPRVEVVGECGDGRSAVRATLALAPDLLFLDVQMPELNGFAALRAIGVEKAPAVIFVTAFDRYAVEAFEVHALDYLLKPFSEDRFRAALNRALARLEQGEPEDVARRIGALLEEVGGRARDGGRRRHLDRLPIRGDGRITFLATGDVDWIEAVGNYARIHSGRTSHLVRETMTALEAKLDPDTFLRIHRSTIVNLGRCRELRPLPHGEYEVLLENGTRVILSRRYRAKLKGRFGLDP
ncbi:MAG TPA: LytTR family DNA-binding domain-containing protein [Gemmatimonadota bacterium]|jgi:two-component system LytT family response regulator